MVDSDNGVSLSLTHFPYLANSSYLFFSPSNAQIMVEERVIDWEI